MSAYRGDTTKYEYNKKKTDVIFKIPDQQTVVKLFLKHVTDKFPTIPHFRM
jgi:hypothetical protein